MPAGQLKGGRTCGTDALDGPNCMAHRSVTLLELFLRRSGVFATPLDARRLSAPYKTVRRLFGTVGEVDAFNAELERVFGESPSRAGGSGSGSVSFPPNSQLTAAGAMFSPREDAAAVPSAFDDVIDSLPLELYLLLVEKGGLEWPSGRFLKAVALVPAEVARMPGVTTAHLRRLHAQGVLQSRGGGLYTRFL